MHRENDRVAQAAVGGEIVGVADELVAIPSAQPAECAEPHEAGLILRQGGYVVLRQSFLDIQRAAPKRVGSGTRNGEQQGRQSEQCRPGTAWWKHATERPFPRRAGSSPLTPTEARGGQLHCPTECRRICGAHSCLSSYFGGLAGASVWKPLITGAGLKLERVKGIEPSSQAWEAHILPLNHTRFGEDAQYLARDRAVGNSDVEHARGHPGTGKARRWVIPPGGARSGPAPGFRRLSIAGMGNPAVLPRLTLPDRARGWVRPRVFSFEVLGVEGIEGECWVCLESLADDRD